jgi:hypothetical protein
MHLLNKQLETSHNSGDEMTINYLGKINLFKIERNNSKAKQRDNSKKEKDVSKSPSKRRKINDTLKNSKNLYIKNPFPTDYHRKKFESYSTTNKNNNHSNFILD